MSNLYVFPVGYLIPIALLAAIGGWYVCGVILAYMDRLNPHDDRTAGPRPKKRKWMKWPKGRKNATK